MEEEEKSWTDARSGVRTGLGLGFEIAANTGLDAFSFIPGSQQAGSAFINYLAQKIRGGEVSKGEILAAAATSQIPGLTQAKALTRGGRFYRSAAKGGISGGVTTTSMSLVDEGELPSFGEFATGVTAGGVMGGAFDLAPATLTGKLGKEVDDIKYDSDVFLRQLKSRITGGSRIDHPDIVYRSGQYDFGEKSVGAAQRRIDATDLPDADDTAAMTRYYDQEAAINKALSQEQTVSRKNVKNNLDLYGADPDIFEDYDNLRDAMNMPDVRGGRFVKVDNKYYTVFTRGGKQQVLPYNKWYSRNVNPFMVPKQLLKKLKKFEGQQQGDLLKVSKKNPAGVPTIKVPYGTQGKFREVVPPTKYAKGTVDEFNNWYKGVFKLQKEEQALNRQVSEMLEKLGNIEARNPGKKVFDTDLSHIAPRSKGGSGLTFQEAWILNQQRGADDILDDNILSAAGIPKNWEELFYLWLAQKKPGRELQTAIGPLSQINVDDYFALSKGEALNVVGKRRKDIRNMINRQIGNPNQYRMPGKRGTFQDDFEAAVRASKKGQVGGDIFLNDKLLDIRWVAENFDDLLEIGDI
tara:strand:+ start:241 stop:1974 length:1734 start_codon:yes stop_codon:yes gene_type:complete